MSLPPFTLISPEEFLLQRQRFLEQNAIMLEQNATLLAQNEIYLEQIHRFNFMQQGKRYCSPLQKRQRTDPSDAMLRCLEWVGEVNKTMKSEAGSEYEYSEADNIFYCIY